MAIRRAARDGRRAKTSDTPPGDERYRVVLGAMREGVVLFGPDGRARLWNESAERILGLSGEQLAGRQPEPAGWTLVREDGTAWPADERPVAVVLRTGEPQVNAVAGVRRADGLVSWVLLNVRAVPGEEGGVAAVATYSDISRRKEAVAAREATERRLRAAVDASLDAFFIMCAVADADGRTTDFEFVDANMRAGELVGMPRDDLLEHRLCELFPLAVTEGLFEILREVYDTGVPFDGEHRQRDPRFTTQWLRLQVIPLADGVAVTARDVTHARARAEQVAAERRFLAALLDSTSEAIIAFDGAGETTLVNRAARQIFGVPPTGPVSGEAIERLPRFRAGGGGPLPPADQPLARVRRGEEVRDQALDLAPPGAARRTVVANGRAIVDAEGRQIGGVVVARDDTERRRAEQLKDQLVGTASHELRTPLTSIRGALELLLARAGARLDDRERGLLDMALRNTNRLVRLIGDLLDVERIESGRGPLEAEVVSAGALLGVAEEVSRPLADEAGVRLVLARDPVPVRADADRVVQVLTNLLANAIKFSPRGATVTATAAPAGDEVQFTVRDEGRGIPPDMLEPIFERFVQVDAADARERGGAGLGLAIARAIVRQHGGRIWAESEVGVGSTFHFTLPRAEARR